MSTHDGPATNRGGARGPGSAEFVGERGEPASREAGGKLGREIPLRGGNLVLRRVLLRLQATGRFQHLASRGKEGRRKQLQRQKKKGFGV